MSEHTKDRKKSAHWSDSDTDILMNLLLRYKDSGRTSDNGFKPDVWKEAAELVQGTTVLGGPKTPEACKSRWQRLQRDFKVVKDLEATPGFAFDRHAHKISASQESWDVLLKTASDVPKWQKIHLPWYDVLAVLCPMENPRLRPRASKPRSSLGTLSDSSSMLSLSVGTQPQTPHIGLNGDAAVMNGHVQGIGLGMGDANMINWDGGEIEVDGTEYDGTFTMPDGHTFTMTQGQKRMGYDPTLMPSAAHSISLHSRPSPPKKARTAPSQPVSSRSQHQQLSHHHHQHQQQNQQHQQHQHQHQNHHQHPMFQFHTQNPAAGPSHSPDFNSTPTNLDNLIPTTSPSQTLTTMPLQHPQPHMSSSSQAHNHAVQNRQLSGHTSNIPDHDNHPLRNFVPISQRSQTHPQPSNPHHSQQAAQPTPPPVPTASARHTPESVNLIPTADSSPINHSTKAQLQAAGQSEAQRRTQAIINLQDNDMDFSDEDMVEIMAEFEFNVAAADTYLAIRKENLRKLYLIKIVKRRKRV